MLKRKINTFIAVIAVLAVGIGASYIIITFANSTDLHILSTDTTLNELP